MVIFENLDFLSVSIFISDVVCCLVYRNDHLIVACLLKLKGMGCRMVLLHSGQPT